MDRGRENLQLHLAIAVKVNPIREYREYKRASSSPLPPVSREIPCIYRSDNGLRALSELSPDCQLYFLPENLESVLDVKGQSKLFARCLI